MSTATARLLRDLEATRDDTLQYFTLSETDLEAAYGPGKWSIRFILHHLADSETVLYERIRRVICEPPQTLMVFDQEAWAKELDYSRVPLDISREVYVSIRNATIHLADRFYETHGHLTFVHSTMGLRTLHDEFDKVAAHNAKHLGHIRMALAASSST